MSNTARVVAEPRSADHTAVGLLHDAASRHPDRPALVDGEVVLSYAALVSEVRQRADQLRE